MPLDPADPRSETLPCLSIVLGRTKTGSADEDTRVLLIGPPVAALEAWIAEAGIAKGPVFRAIDRWGTLRDKALTPQAVNLIVKARCAKAGLDPSAFSAHGLRSGFLTEAARRGVPLPEAMRQSQHRSAPTGFALLQRRRSAARRRGAACSLALRIARLRWAFGLVRPLLSRPFPTGKRTTRLGSRQPLPIVWPRRRLQGRRH